jgi:hypothetical protein
MNNEDSQAASAWVNKLRSDVINGCWEEQDNRVTLKRYRFREENVQYEGSGQQGPRFIHAKSKLCLEGIFQGRTIVEMNFE